MTSDLDVSATYSDDPERGIYCDAATPIGDPIYSSRFLTVLIKYYILCLTLL